MDWNAEIRRAFVDAGRAPDDDIVEELAQHAASAYEAQRADGVDRDQAERHVRALIRTWNREAPNLTRRPKRLDAIPPPAVTSARTAGLLQDIRYGLRMLLRQKAFAAVAILTMAIGIGIMTTLFSVVYGVLLKPLPWPHADRLVWLAERHPGATRQNGWTMTNMAYLPWRDQPSTTLDGMGAWSGQTMTMSGAGDTGPIVVATMSASVFAVLQVPPVLGSVFTVADEDATATVGKVVLSYGLWQERFGANREAVGQTIQLNGKPFVVTGVMPDAFGFPGPNYRAWIPLTILPPVSADGKAFNATMFNAIARLRDGVTPAQAAAEGTARARGAAGMGNQMTLMFFGTNTAPDIEVVRAIDAMTSDVRTALMALLIAVALLLVAATMNIAGLQLARAIARRREMAIRSAIGAGLGRIARQLVIENLMLCAIGGAAGLLLAAVLHRALPLVLRPFPRLTDVVLDNAVVGFAAVLTLVVAFGVGLLPSLSIRRLNLIASLSQDGTNTVGGRRGGVARTRAMIMTAQVAVACTLLMGAALLGRSFFAMVDTDRGYDPRNVLTARLTAPSGTFSAEDRVRIVDELTARLRAVNGVMHATYAVTTPLSGSETISSFTMPSRRPPIGREIEVHATRHVVGDDYFATMGIRVPEGRAFTAADQASAEPVAIVSRSFARQYLSDTPLSDTITNFIRDDGVAFRVIGIAEDVLEKELTDPPQPTIYTLPRHSTPYPSVVSAPTSFIVRTASDPMPVLAVLKGFVRERDASLSLDRIATLDDRVSSSLSRPRLYAMMLGMFGVSALLIAGVGLFGVLSYSVAQRHREFALRTALGATPADVGRLVLRQAAVITGAGLIAGMWISFMFARSLSGLLFGIDRHDPASFVLVPLTIAAIAVVATIVPAIRAVRVDPLTALRSQA